MISFEIRCIWSTFAMDAVCDGIKNSKLLKLSSEVGAERIDPVPDAPVGESLPLLDGDDVEAARPVPQLMT